MDSAGIGLRLLAEWGQLSPQRRVLCRALLWEAARDNAPLAAMLGRLYLGQTGGDEDGSQF